MQAGECFGDSYHRHRSRSIVIGAVEDGIGPGTVRRAQAVTHRLHASGLGRRGRPHRRVGAHGTDNAIERVCRVVVDRAAGESHMVMMRADRDVFPAEHRIASGQHRDHVARWVGEWRAKIADLAAQRIAELALPRRGRVSPQQSTTRGRRDEE